MSEVHQPGGRKNRVLNPKLQLLWRREQQDKNPNASVEEKKNHRKKLREQLQAMSESEKTALRDRLQAQWDALPAPKRQRLTEKLKKVRAAGQAGTAGAKGAAKGAGKGGGAAARKAKRQARKAAAAKR